MRCKKCGCELPENSKFCFACGAKAEPEEEKKEQKETVTEQETTIVEEGKYCPYCGGKNDADAVFCCVCGKNMSMEDSEAGNRAGTSGGKDEAAKGKLSAGKAMGAAAVAVVVVGGIVLLANLGGADAQTKIAYLKNGKIMQTDLDKYKKEPMKYSGSYGDEDAIYGMRVTYSKDGKYICYPTNVEEEEGEVEFDLNFQKVGKEGGATEIDDSVIRYKLLDNNKILYLKAGNRTLYISDRKGNKEKIASDVSSFKVDKEQNNIVWVEQENGTTSLYQQDLRLKKEKKELSQSADNYLIGENLEQIVVQDDEKLYLIKNFKEREKIASDVSWVVANNEDDEVLYYIKEEKEKIDAMDFVEDDTDGDEDQEWLIEELEDYEIETSRISLYCYKDGKEIEVAKEVGGDVYAQDDSETVLFTKLNLEELPKIRASKLDGTYEVDEKYHEALRKSAEVCLYNGKEIVALDPELSPGRDGQSFLIDDEKNIGYVLKTETDQEGEITESTLLSFKTGKNADGKCRVVAEEADTMMGAKNGDIYYLTDMDEGMGDLYCNDELIDSDVLRSSLEFTKEKEYPVYMTDYNESKGIFTLKMFNGKDAKVIADDVFDYKIVDEKKIVVLADYDDDDETGTLKLYRGKDKLIELDEDVTCLFGGQYN